MISLAVKVEPAEEFTLCISHFLPSVLFNNSSRSTSKIINLVGSSRTAVPAVFPGNSLSITSEVISVSIFIFDEFLFDYTAFAVCNIICIILVCGLCHCALHNIAAGIQHIQIFLGHYLGYINTMFHDLSTCG